MKDLYIYQEISEYEKRAFLKIKSPKRNCPKIKISYIKKRAFRKMKEFEEENNQTVKILGYTEFKPFNGSEEEYENCLDNFVFVKGERYCTSEDKLIFKRIKGYVEIVPLSDSYEKEFEENSDIRYFLAVTRFSVIPLLPLLPLLLLFLSMYGCPSINNQSEKIVVETVVPETTENVTLPIDKNADEWNGLMPTGPSSEAMQDEIEFVGYDELTVSSDNRDIELVNPYGNTVYFRYSVYVNDDLIHTTDLIPPGEAVKYNIYSKLNEQGFSSDDEKISLVFFIKTYDIYSQSACTPCSVKTKISIS